RRRVAGDRDAKLRGRAGRARNRKEGHGVMMLAFETPGARLAHAGSLPPCGGGVGRGVAADSESAATPLPVPPPQGGRGRWGTASFTTQGKTRVDDEGER